MPGGARGRQWQRGALCAARVVEAHIQRPGAAVADGKCQVVTPGAAAAAALPVRLRACSAAMFSRLAKGTGRGLLDGLPAPPKLSRSQAGPRIAPQSHDAACPKSCRPHDDIPTSRLSFQTELTAECVVHRGGRRASTAVARPRSAAAAAGPGSAAGGPPARRQTVPAPPPPPHPGETHGKRVRNQPRSILLMQGCDGRAIPPRGSAPLVHWCIPGVPCCARLRGHMQESDAAAPGTGRACRGTAASPPAAT